MNYFKESKIQISPCIAAKAKFTLNLTNKMPTNSKACKYQYWCKVIDTFSFQMNLTKKTTEEAKNKFKSLIK
jgi:hypothetical protein